MSSGRHKTLRRRLRPRRLRSRVALLVALNLVVIGLDAGVAASRSDDPAKAPAPVAHGNADLAANTLRSEQISTLLDKRTAAVAARNEKAFLATVDPTQTAFYASQKRVFDNLGAVPIGLWRYVLNDSEELPPYPANTSHYKAAVWAPLVTLSYSLKGFDTKPALIIEHFTFVKRPTGWLIGSDSDYADGGSPSGRGIWDYGKVSVARGKSSLVLGHPRSASELQMIANLTDDAISHVNAVWGDDWSRRVVVLVPDTQEELASIIAEGNDLSEIAAVAVAQNAGGRTPGAEFGDRVILNPTNFDQLSPIGQRVILRHEVTHVASRSVTGSIAPQWLVEGIADYVGYRDAGLPTTLVAHELQGDIRKGIKPTTLPTDSDFASFSNSLAQAYEKAWLACRLIVSLKGEAALVRFYRQVGLSKETDEAKALDDASRSVLGIPWDSFVVQWRSYVLQQLQ